MGYSVYLYKIFGVPVSTSELKTTTKKRGCEHEIQENVKFCPECGKPAYQEKEVNLLDSFEDGCLSYFSSDYESNAEVILGFKLDYVSSNSNLPHMISLSVDARDAEKLKKMYAEICEFCEKNNIAIDPNNITTYALMHHSY